MERNTETTVNQLKPGDRFYRLRDKKKTVYEMQQQQTAHTLKAIPYMCKADNSRHPIGIKGDVPVVFLRNSNDGNSTHG